MALPHNSSIRLGRKLPGGQPADEMDKHDKLQLCCQARSIEGKIMIANLITKNKYYVCVCVWKSPKQEAAQGPNENTSSSVVTNITSLPDEPKMTANCKGTDLKCEKFPNAS